MKILFLCASLEPGRDGVGDYTERLAVELRSRGHDCLCAGINDRFVGLDSVENGLLRAAGFFRLSRKKSWAARMEILRKEVAVFQPDWVSLQYVPWGFGHRGLHPGLGAMLRAAAQELPIQTMCHELWLDKILPLPWRQRLLGLVQKYAIKRFLVELAPRIVHTHIAHYRELLGSLGFKSRLLPLHGNIPVSSTPAGGRAWLERRAGVPADAHVSGFFGNLWQTLDIDLLKRLAEEFRIARGGGCIVGAGGLAPSGEANWKRIEKEMGGVCKVVSLGSLTSHDASSFLSALDLGLTTYPAVLAGKSGAVAAMLEHGVPVRTVGRLRIGAACSEVIPPDKGSAVSMTASKMVSELEAAG